MMLNKANNLRSSITIQPIASPHTLWNNEKPGLNFNVHVRNTNMLVQHLHSYGDVMFKINNGDLTMQVDEDIHTLHSGESMIIPEETAISWWNDEEKSTVDFELSFIPVTDELYNLKASFKTAKVKKNKGELFQISKRKNERGAAFINNQKSFGSLFFSLQLFSNK